jgi:hypothetical protein
LELMTYWECFVLCFALAAIGTSHCDLVVTDSLQSSSIGYGM